MRHPPTHLSDHVKRKQQELYQLKQILHQKEEELHQIVKKEEDYKSFLVAQGRYGVIPSLINVSFGKVLYNALCRDGARKKCNLPFWKK